ncbi:group 3 secretory phospholipase A2 [Spea bombifrons]|uniref:group 3 secretory phospholipase A2 n=1 Tax=Spea bombifrons TaxID=233779 RepID=UPI00234AB84A|nr:group 3 secretory phospholipase A2 [Spea bombifrons]
MRRDAQGGGLTQSSCLSPRDKEKIWSAKRLKSTSVEEENIQLYFVTQNWRLSFSSGLFQGVDHCCREHDHCAFQIQSFDFQYGMRNYRLHTVSHCECDERFRMCLHAINDTISMLVGIMYFNILEMPCFSLKERNQCVERHWWGGCKKYGLLPKAKMQKQAPFNYTHPNAHHNSTNSNLLQTRPTILPLHRGTYNLTSSSKNITVKANVLMHKVTFTFTPASSGIMSHSKHHSVPTESSGKGRQRRLQKKQKNGRTRLKTKQLNKNTEAASEKTLDTALQEEMPKGLEKDTARQ